MNPSLPIRRLYWKEARQLLPLLMLLGALAILLHLIGLLSSDFTLGMGFYSGIHYAVLIALPILVAVGAGAITIGQEKELRTIQWLSSLPIKPYDLIRVKLVSCVLGLLAAWLVSGAMLLMVGLLDSRRLEIPTSLAGESASFFLTWPLHSLSLLLSGIAIAWYVRSSLSGLLLLIPIALFPGFSADGFEYLYISFPNVVSLSPLAKFVVLSTIQIGICLSAYWLSWKFAKQALSAQVVHSGKRNLLKTFGYSRSTAEAKAWQPRAILHPASALVWQSVRQNRKFLFWTSAVIVAAFFLGLQNESKNLGFSGRSVWRISEGPAWLPFMLTGFLGACWFGVLTFQSDRLQRRIGFLSDRGVSVTLTLLTRQAVPISVLCAATIVCYSLFGWNDNPRFRGFDDPFLIVSLVWLLLGNYVSSQWIGQVFTSSISAAVASPPIAVATLYYLSFAWETLSAPIWLLVLCFVIPLLATWTTMRRWMDSRIDKVFWWTHAGFLLAFLFIPWIPLGATVLTLPSGMSRDIALELAEEASKYKDYAWTRDQQRLSLVIPRSPTEAVKLAPSETLASLRQQVLSTLQQRVQATSGPLVIDSDVTDYIIAEVTLYRDRLLKKSKGKTIEKVDEDTGNADAVTIDAQQYRALLKLASDIVVRTRLCHSIRQQDLCDTIEIWLLSELQRANENPIAMKMISDDLYAIIAKRLSKLNDRNDSRRRAVALSWQESQMMKPDPKKSKDNLYFTFGQYYLGEYYYHRDSWVEQAIRKRRVPSLASELWMLVKAGSRNSDVPNTDRKLEKIPDAQRSRIASIVEVPSLFYGIGLRGEFLRADNPNRFVFETEGSQRRAPASQWFADWERQAEALVSKELP